MNAPARKFDIQPATASAFSLSIGLMGWPGAGKTFSALTLASGMRLPGLGKPLLIDTERRAAKYSKQFDFDIINFPPPFRPTDFLAAIQTAVRERNPCAVITDSLSDEHEGEGGVLDWHEAELQRMAGDDWSKRERVGQAAWIKPKSDRRMMINGFLRILTPLIFCFRAREKTKVIKNGQGKAVPTNIGMQPIAPLEIVSALDLVCFLPPNSGGVPKWQTDSASTDFVIKLPVQFRDLFAAPGPITADHGRALAEWARGGNAPRQPGDNRAADQAAPAAPAITSTAGAAEDDEGPDSDQVAQADKLLADAATHGVAALKTTWELLPKDLQRVLKAALDRRHKPAAEAVGP